MSGTQSALLGGGSIPLAAPIQFPYLAPAYIAQEGKEYLRQGSLLAYAAGYLAALPYGLGVWGNDAGQAATTTGTENHVRYLYSGGNYVAVSDASLSYSASLTSGWAASTGAPTGISNRFRAATSGSYVVVASGSSNTAPVYSTNGASFTAVGGTFTTYPATPAVEFGNNIWVALSTLSATAGEQGYIANANPSGTWTVGASTNVGMTAVRACKYGNSNFVAVGASASATAGKIATCTTPAGGWTDRTNGAGVTFGASDTVEWLEFDGTYHWAWATTPGLIRSADGGVTWTRITNCPLTPAANFGTAAGGGRFALTTRPVANQDVWFAATTDGGATWTHGAIYRGRAVSAAMNAGSLSYANSKWIECHTALRTNPLDLGTMSLTAPDYIGVQIATIGQLAVAGGTSSVSIPAHVRIK